MIFLNPYFLFGLGAAAIPIIIHLLNLRKIRTIEFSTLTFLKELKRTHIRRLQLKQLLLLVLRTLLIIFIVLAFARPAIKTTGGFIGGDANTTAIILLDNSASMDVHSKYGNVFRQSVEYGYSIMEMLRDGDEVALIKQSDLPEVTSGGLTANRLRVKEIIGDAAPSAVHNSFYPAFEKARDLFAASRHINKELYIISDLQPGHWEEMKTEDPIHLPDHIRSYIIPVGNDAIENASLGNFVLRSSLIEAGKMITFDVEVHNHGTNDIRNNTVSVFLNNRRVAQQSVDIPAGGTTIVEFSVIPESVGIIEGYIEIDDDDFELDNRYYFVLTIPEQIRVLLVAPTLEETRFIRTAIDAHGVNTEQSSLTYEYVQVQNFPAVDLTKYQVVIIINVPEWSDIQAERIATYVRQGGGLVIFPGDDVNVSNYNRVFLPRLDLPEIKALEGGTRDEQTSSSFDRIDLNHPIFSHIFSERIPSGEEQLLQTTDRRIESPHIRRYIKIGSGTDTPVISLIDGTPFLLSGLRENGAILFYSVNPSLQWSDFPLRGIFVPLFHRSILFTAALHTEDKDFIAGEETRISIPAARLVGRTDYILRHPDGLEEKLQPELLAAAGMLEFSIQTADTPGVYNVLSGDETIKAFAVNLHPAESSSERISKDELTELLSKYGINEKNFITDTELLAEIITESRYGTELWKTFVLLALLIAVLETVISRDTRQLQVKDEKLYAQH